MSSHIISHYANHASQARLTLALHTSRLTYHLTLNIPHFVITVRIFLTLTLHKSRLISLYT